MTGAENDNESSFCNFIFYIFNFIIYKFNTLSNIPPWPGRRLPESFMLAVLLINDSNKSPIIEVKQIF